MVEAPEAGGPKEFRRWLSVPCTGLGSQSPDLTAAYEFAFVRRPWVSALR